MSELNNQERSAQTEAILAKEKSKQISTIGWTAGTVGVAALCALAHSATWPMTVGVAAVAGMLGTVCFRMMKTL